MTRIHPPADEGRLDRCTHTSASTSAGDGALARINSGSSIGRCPYTYTTASGLRHARQAQSSRPVWITSHACYQVWNGRKPCCSFVCDCLRCSRRQSSAVRSWRSVQPRIGWAPTERSSVFSYLLSSHACKATESRHRRRYSSSSLKTENTTQAALRRTFTRLHPLTFTAATLPDTWS